MEQLVDLITNNPEAVQVCAFFILGQNVVAFLAKRLRKAKIIITIENGGVRVEFPKRRPARG